MGRILVGGCRNNEPVVMALGTSNVLIHSVHISGHEHELPRCPAGSTCTPPRAPSARPSSSTSPGGVQVANARVNARIDVYQSVYSRLDNLRCHHAQEVDRGDFQSFK